MAIKKVDIDDIYGILDIFSDYVIKDIHRPFKALKSVAIINGAFIDKEYFINPNSKSKVLYRVIY